MTVLDSSVTYCDVLMILPKRTIVDEIKLCEGYRYVEYTDSKKEAIASLMHELKMGSKEEASCYLDSLLSKDRKFFKEHSICVVDDCNRLIGFACLMKDETFHMEQPCIGFFGVKEDYQRNGIGKAMITRLSLDNDALKLRFPLYIKLNSYAYVAVAMLSRMGFQPFMGEWQNKDEEASRKDWQVLTDILKEKTNQGQL